MTILSIDEIARKAELSRALSLKRRNSWRTKLRAFGTDLALLFLAGSVGTGISLFVLYVDGKFY
jgi:hypothetical protein